MILVSLFISSEDRMGEFPATVNCVRRIMISFPVIKTESGGETEDQRGVAITYCFYFAKNTLLEIVSLLSKRIT